MRLRPDDDCVLIAVGLVALVSFVMVCLWILEGVRG